MRVSEPVLTEAVYILREDGVAVAPLFQVLERDAVRLELDMAVHLPRIRTLMSRYRQIDPADASIVVMSELHGRSQVPTVQRALIEEDHNNSLVVAWPSMASEAVELRSPRRTGCDQTMHIELTKQEVIEEMTRRLVEFYQPVRIYLFGPEARGESGPDSDLDFCVVLPDDAPRSPYRDRRFYRRVWGLGAAVDVVRLPCSDFDARAAHVVASLPATVLREGRLLYDAGRIAA